MTLTANPRRRPSKHDLTTPPGSNSWHSPCTAIPTDGAALPKIGDLTGLPDAASVGIRDGALVDSHQLRSRKYQHAGT